MKRSTLRLTIGVLSLLGLLCVYLFQRTNVAELLGVANDSYRDFVINRSIRFILNDVMALGIIYSLFPERKFVMFAVYVQVVGLVFFLIPYFLLRYYTDLHGPLLNFLHRIILNPILMLLLIPAFYFLKTKKI